MILFYFLNTFLIKSTQTLFTAPFVSLNFLYILLRLWQSVKYALNNSLFLFYCFLSIPSNLPLLNFVISVILFSNIEKRHIFVLQISASKYWAYIFRIFKIYIFYCHQFFLFVVHHCLFVWIHYTIFSPHFYWFYMQNLPCKILQSYFVYDNFKIMVFAALSQVFLRSTLSLIIFFSALWFLFFLTKYFKLVRVKKIFHLFHLNFSYHIFFVSTKVFIVKLIDIIQNSIFTIFCFIIEGLWFLKLLKSLEILLKFSKSL